MTPKSEQLQIRVSPAQKAELKRLAEEAGLNVSQFVLATVFPSGTSEFSRLAHALRPSATRVQALAALRTFLRDLETDDLKEAVRDFEIGALPVVPRAYAAAAVEEATRRRRLAPPGWVATVEPLAEPHFAWSPQSLRPHLMRITPVAYKRLNLFVDGGGREVRGWMIPGA